MSKWKAWLLIGALSALTALLLWFGTRPPEMAEEIWQFLIEQSRPTLTTWWMPWPVNLAALPFVLLLGAALGEVLLRKLRVIKPEPVEMQGDS